MCNKAQHTLHPDTLKHVVKSHISRIISDCNGDISRAALRLGIARTTIYRAIGSPRRRVVKCRCGRTIRASGLNKRVKKQTARG